METSSLPAKGCTIYTYMLRPLREDSLSCHTCCDPGPFFWSHPKDCLILIAFCDKPMVLRTYSNNPDPNDK